MPELRSVEDIAPPRLVELLRWTDEGYVATSEHDLRAYAWVPGVGVLDVRDEMEALAAAGLVVEPVQSLRWEVTRAGRQAMEAGAS
jgi:hypothetical protein